MDEYLTSLLMSGLAQIMCDENSISKTIVIVKNVHKDLGASIRIIEETDDFIKLKIDLREGKDESKNTRDVPKGYH